MQRSGRTPDQKGFVVYRSILPIGFATAAAHKTLESDSSSSSGNPLAAMLFRGIILLILGIVLLPISLIFRILLRRWTIQANVGETSTRWRARSRAAAGAGVEAVAGALTRGESLDQQFAGLSRLG